MAIVIDTGSALTKAGFAGEQTPKLVFPTVVGEPINKDDHKKRLIGESALSHQDEYSISDPIVRGAITNWEDVEKIWSCIFEDELKVSSSEHNVLLTEPVYISRKDRETTTQIMFEKYNVQGTFLAKQAVLSLYATGREKGVVVEMGHGVTNIVPVYEGFAMTKAIETIDLAGVDVTQHLSELLQRKGVDLTDQRETLRDIKETFCHVSADFAEELKAPGANKVYELPDKTQISIGDESFRAPEALFQPSLLRQEGEGVHKKLFSSIMKCDIDLRRDLYNNVVLSGGSSMLPGLPDRLAKELKKLVPASINPKLIAAPERKYSAWIGGSILASLSTFQPMWITGKDYAETGASVVHKKCI